MNPLFKHLHEHFHDRMHRHGHVHLHGEGRGHEGHGRGGRGGRGARGFGGDDFSDGGMFRGRKFSSDDLQLLLLALLEKGDGHGYQLIKAIHDMTEGLYSPSPGMVYPALTYLEDVGYAAIALDGNRKLYALSEPGRQYLMQQRARADELLAMLAHMARKVKFMRGAMRDDAEGRRSFSPVLNAARRTLKELLFAQTDASPEKQASIAAILDQAAKDIAKLGT